MQEFEKEIYLWVFFKEAGRLGNKSFQKVPVLDDGVEIENVCYEAFTPNFIFCRYCPLMSW